MRGEWVMFDMGEPCGGSDRADRADGLPSWRRVLAVVAHPDDESFGLGGVIDAFVSSGARVQVLCFTQGEASSLGAGPDLQVLRRQELALASGALGVDEATMLEHPDGDLSRVRVEDLAGVVAEVVERVGVDGLLVFDDNGVTGHADHAAATRAAVLAGRQAGVPVLAWALPQAITQALNEELGTRMEGRPPELLDLCVATSREVQRHAAMAHVTQAVPDSPLWRRWELQGDREWLRWLAGAGDAAGSEPAS